MDESTCAVHEADGRGYTEHCLHYLSPGERVCCWCGDIFIGGGDDPEHGENVPTTISQNVRREE